MNQRIFRIFLKPTGQTWADFPLVPGQSVQSLMGIWRTEGVLINEAGGWVVPLDGMLFGAIIEIEAMAGGPSMHFKPSIVRLGSNEKPEPPKAS